MSLLSSKAFSLARYIRTKAYVFSICMFYSQVVSNVGVSTLRKAILTPVCLAGGKRQPFCPKQLAAPFCSLSQRGKMRSVLVENGVLSVVENTPVPKPKQGDVLIKVSHSGVNRLDLIQAAGKYPPPPGESDILGVEVSGIVAELSPEAAEKSGLAEGDRVFALIGGGGYADFCTAPYQTVMKVPEGVSMEHAAGIAETYMTAYSGLFWSGRLVDGETLLIHAGASGVGLAAIQLAKSLVRNVTVIVTAGSEEKLQVCAKNGADLGINYKTHNFADEVLKATGNKGTDVVLDFIGGSYFDNHTKCMALDGRLVLLGLLGGAVTQSPLNLGVLLRKRLQIVPSTLRSRGLDYKHQLSKEISAKALPLFASKQLNVVVDSCFSLEESSQAHQRMKENKNIGKIVISLS